MTWVMHAWIALGSFCNMYSATEDIKWDTIPILPEQSTDSELIYKEFPPQWLMNPTSNHEDAGSIPGLTT